jgi:hypothetical protein
MKLRSALLCALSLGLAAAADPGLTQVRTVYLLPMGGGLDQFLANRLTQSGRYQVVTDPNQADAILTDRIGTDFEDRMKELYPPPPPPEPEVKAEDKAEEKQKDEERSLASLMGDASAGRRSSTFGRSRGTVFLVDRSVNRVIWSTYVLPRSRRPDELNRVADQIVGRLDGAAGKEVKRLRKEEAKPAPATAKP